MRRFVHHMTAWSIVLLAAVLILVGCTQRRPAGKVIGSRSAQTWTGPAFYLRVQTADGAEREVAVTREEYHKLRHGEQFPGD